MGKNKYPFLIGTRALYIIVIHGSDRQLEIRLFFRHPISESPPSTYARLPPNTTVPPPSRHFHRAGIEKKNTVQYI